ncbi:MAG TPA: DUF2182 domain-containing protein [Solirubrobacteraceae bacterium]|jgi:hypothetical protein|nr:DUF2182 domain-containing protein [Solirubrobacteraceae bacterium]
MTDLAVRPRAESRLIPTAALASVLTAAAAGWLVLSERMASMDGGPGGDPGALGWFAAAWAVMTAAMMLPASAPALLRLVRTRPSKAPAAGVLFLAGYGAVWMLAGLVGYSLVEAARGLHLGTLAWSAAGHYLAGASVAAAGLYQLTEVKRRWLARCTAPALSLARHPFAGALLAGAEHGRCCVACCWALMAALYALGREGDPMMFFLTEGLGAELLQSDGAHHQFSSATRVTGACSSWSRSPSCLRAAGTSARARSTTRRSTQSRRRTRPQPRTGSSG